MVLGHPKRLWALGKPSLPCKKTGAGLHDRRRTRGHASLRGEGHSWMVAKSTQRPLPRESSFIIANIYQIFLVYLSYYAPYRSLVMNSVIVCYISTSQIKDSHYILGKNISISLFFFPLCYDRSTSPSSPKIFVRSTTNFGSLASEIASEGLFYSILFSSSWIASFVAHLIKH